MAVVYGGRSGEHEVSIESARSLIQAIDTDRYDVIPIGISQEGAWVAAPPPALLTHGMAAGDQVLPSADPGQPGLIALQAASPPSAALSDGIDVVFPVVHGTYGEDGCLQGLFELGGVAYVGSGVLASAVGMDKILMKTVFRAHGFPVADYVPVERADWEEDPAFTLSRVEEAIGFPCFAKPASLGSSVGISKVRDRAELAEALDLAAQFGPRIVVERALDAREIECGVLGNRRPSASVVGEVIPSREFYDYEAKYHDPSTRFVIPADVGAGVAASIQSLAVGAFEAIGAAGLARVDFFLDRNDGAIYINEINTIPGFTSMSVYPRLWAASGIPYRELISQLIELACERRADAARNRTRYEE